MDDEATEPLGLAFRDQARIIATNQTDNYENDPHPPNGFIPGAGTGVAGPIGAAGKGGGRG